MIKIVNLESACRALAERFPEKYKVNAYDGLGYTFRVGTLEKPIEDLCACDFHSILEMVGLEIEVSVTGDYRVFKKDEETAILATLGKMQTKKEASQAGFIAAVEWLINEKE